MEGREGSAIGKEGEEVHQPFLLTPNHGFTWSQSTHLGYTKGLSLPSPSSGDDSNRSPQSFEELRERCRPSPFLQQHPLPRSPRGSSALGPLLAPGLPTPRGLPSTAPLHKHFPEPPVRHQPQCAPLFSGSPQLHPSSPLPFCFLQLLESVSTPRLPQIHLPGPPVQCPGDPSLQNPLPARQSPHLSPLGHPAQLCLCSQGLGP